MFWGEINLKKQGSGGKWKLGPSFVIGMCPSIEENGCNRMLSNNMQINHLVNLLLPPSHYESKVSKILSNTNLLFPFHQNPDGLLAPKHLFTQKLVWEHSWEKGEKEARTMNKADRRRNAADRLQYRSVHNRLRGKNIPYMHFLFEFIWMCCIAYLKDKISTHHAIYSN